MSASSSAGGAAPSGRARVVTGVALVLLMLLLARATLTRQDFISDDAWISLRYARNLVEGHGLLWNPGEAPVEGYSNLLWVLLAALGLGAGIPAPSLLLAMGLGMAALCVPATYAVTRVAGGSRLSGLAAAALVSVSSLVAGTAITGLETPLLCLLMTAATGRLLAEEREVVAGGTPRPWSALLFGLLTISHVEGPIYLAIPLIIRLFRPGAGGPWRALRELGRRDLLVAGLLLVLPVGQELLRVLYYGDWMPNTVRVKTSGGAEMPLILGIRYALFSLTVNRALLVLLGLGALMAFVFRRGLSDSERVATRCLILPWLACAFFSVIANGDMLNQFRFMAPAAPTLIALGVLGWQRLLPHVHPTFRIAFLPVPLCLGLIAAHRDLSVQVVQHNRQPQGLSDDVLSSFVNALQGEYGMVRTYAQPLGRLWSPEQPMGGVQQPQWFVQWVLENVPVGGAVMFPDVGVLGYALADGRVLDARGLNSRGAAQLVSAQPAEGPAGLEDPAVQAFLAELAVSNPDALVLQYSDGQIWGPVEAALQASGKIADYSAVAAGQYTSRFTGICVLEAGRPRPTLPEVLARYRRMEEEMPGVFDWAGRRLALEKGLANAAEAGRELSAPLALYPAGAWYRAATLPPAQGR